jgi:hypothetical protein
MSTKSERKNRISDPCCTALRLSWTTSIEHFRFKRLHLEQGFCLSHLRLRFVHSASCQSLTISAAQVRHLPRQACG